MFRLTDVVKHLLIINIIVYIGAQILLPDARILSLYYPESEFFEPFQFVTHMFMHALPQNGLTHIIFNMLMLVFLGPMVESVLGPKKFLIMYFVAGFGAVALHMLVWYLELSGLSAGQFQSIMRDPNARVVGASGAIFGVLVAFASLFPNVKLMLLFPPIPVKAKYLTVALIAIDLFSGIGRFNTGIAHFAHIGGALFAFLLLIYWGKVRLRR